MRGGPIARVRPVVYLLPSFPTYPSLHPMPDQPTPRPGDVYEIPVEGSLGLLALGAVGLKAWREVRDRHLAAHPPPAPGVAEPPAEADTPEVTGPPVVVVSGLPRSGTSMMMQMLRAGGLPLLTDEAREADANNPRGYLELEKVKALAKDKSWVKEAGGQAVKVVAQLVPHLPRGLAYRVLLMERDLDEVLASQARMLGRLGRGDGADPALIRTVYERHLADAKQWIARHPHAEACTVPYAEAVGDPAACAARVAAFLQDALDAPLDPAAMAAAVDPALYRERAA